MNISTVRNVVYVEGREADTCPTLLVLPIDSDSVPTGDIPAELDHVERVADFGRASKDDLLDIVDHVRQLDPIG